VVDADVVAPEVAAREVGLPVPEDELMFREDDHAEIYYSLRRSSRR
jgi:UDP-GlcNAc:undecaprenyl-phosphate GlcNAc-1-phosphate transferase